MSGARLPSESETGRAGEHEMTDFFFLFLSCQNHKPAEHQLYAVLKGGFCMDTVQERVQKCLLCFKSHDGKNT